MEGEHYKTSARILWCKRNYSMLLLVGAGAAATAIGFRNAKLRWWEIDKHNK